MKIENELPINQALIKNQPSKGAAGGEKARPKDSAMGVGSGPGQAADTVSLSSQEAKGPEKLSEGQAASVLEKVASGIKENPNSPNALHKPIDKNRLEKLFPDITG